jgi:hypothetical protein
MSCCIERGSTGGASRGVVPSQLQSRILNRMRNCRDHITEPTYEELKARLAELEAKQNTAPGVTFKVSDKGGISVYGLGRFPVTLYYEQWIKLLESHKNCVNFWKRTKAS